MSDSIFAKIDAHLTSLRESGKPQRLSGVYKFIINKNGSHHKTWIMNLNDRVLTHGDGKSDVTLTVEDDILFALGTKKMTATEALGGDKIEINDGDASMVMALEPFIAELK